MNNGPFKSFDPFSKGSVGRAPGRRSVAKHLGMQQNQSVVAKAMQSGTARGGTLRAAGETRNSIQAAVAGINNRLVDPTSRLMKNSMGVVSGMGRKTGRGLGKMALGMVKSPKTHVALGMTAMAGVAFMNGAMNQANDIMMERYMRDARYSNRLLSKTSLGQASGNSPLSMSSHVGLSLALSRSRHGR